MKLFSGLLDLVKLHFCPIDLMLVKRKSLDCESFLGELILKRLNGVKNNMVNCNNKV